MNTNVSMSGICAFDIFSITMDLLASCFCSKSFVQSSYCFLSKCSLVCGVQCTSETQSSSVLQQNFLFNHHLTSLGHQYSWNLVKERCNSFYWHSTAFSWAHNDFVVLLWRYPVPADIRKLLVLFFFLFCTIRLN